MIRLTALLILGSLTACTGMAGQDRVAPFPEGMGQYVRPAYLNPVVQPRLPPADACRSQLFLGLVGRHEGAIYIAGLPGLKRILKPSYDEGFEYQPEDPLGQQPRLYEVRDYVSDQVLYAPSITTVSDLVQLGPPQENRLTIELDQYGYVREVRCG